nr:hypothetical protein BaRGS_023801 [Batillaria attramentaria]
MEQQREQMELWPDYWSRFCTFLVANAVPDDRKAQVFLTNQTPAVYKQLANLAAQQNPRMNINDLTMDQIVKFMKEQFDPKLFIVRERFKFWSNMERKPGETLQELAARIRQDAATCDFPSIQDPQDEALRQRFICSVNNEAVLKALFKVKDTELDFAKAVKIAIETEDAAKVAKETVYGSKPRPVNKVKANNKGGQPKNHQQSNSTTSNSAKCYRCGKAHKATDCFYKDSKCNFCQKIGHLEAVCRKKLHQQQQGGRQSAKSSVKSITKAELVKAILGEVPQDTPRLDVPVTIQDQQFTMELDTATTGNFVSVPVWKQLGKPKLDDVTHRYESASKHDLPVLGTFMGQTTDPVTGKQSSIPYIVTKIHDLNLLGRNAIQALGISVDNALGLKSIESQVKSEGAKESHPKTSSTTYASLQKDCHTLCDKFPDLFKEELGCLKDFELEIKFKSDAKPVFHKARPVPFALRDDLTKGYEEGIAKGVWKPVQFNDYGTPVVPIRKTNSTGALKPKLRICGDYSVGINDQLADHRHPMPLPEELMQKLGGGFGYTKIDLADAYNQIKLAPESQRRLALSTHRGVLLQQRLPFGIKSAPGYFQEIMENLTSDLPGVAVFQDDILTSGKDAKDHLSNLERLLTRLNDNGLRCRREKCLFAQPSVEYLGHTLSAEGISKGSKVEAVLKMPPPTDVSSLKSFLGSVQFYGKFIPNLATMAEPLYRLTKKANPWKWGEEEQAAFEQLKNVLSSDQVLVHFDPEKPVGLACDASNVGIGAVLFHRYPDGSERPIANVSKTLTAAERNYSQIHKEALAIIYGLRKFYQYLYGRQFILVTDHKPLTALFGPKKGTPLLAANRLARWALWLNQFDYTIEYRKTADHGNADALSRLPSGDDIDFDREESGEDTDMVCAIRVLSLQVKPFDANILRQESGKDPVIATVMRYVREGWPLKHAEINEEVRKFQKLSDSLSTCHGCLIYGTRVVIPQSLQPKILDLLHIGHFGMERMKQLARTAVYWPGIDAAIEMTSRRCDSCGEHQNKPSKPPVHPWMLPEKPWSRVHLDHAINFMGTNWLVITDAYSKYPCIHPTSSTSTRATLDLLEEDFAHFGYPHTLVSDNATTFVSEEFQSLCKERGITHLTGAPYHPATNGAAERLVQTFKQALRKSSLPPKRALQEFIMQYRRMPTSCGFSPSELLMSRQIRTRIDTLLPSPAHIAQGKQSKEASKTQVTPDSGGVAKVTRQYKAGDPVYALYYGPHHAKQPRWWLATYAKKISDLGAFEGKVPNHVLVNEYEPGQGIMPRSLVLLQDDMYKVHLHGIKEVKQDVITDRVANLDLNLGQGRKASSQFVLLERGLILNTSIQVKFYTGDNHATWGQPMHALELSCDSPAQVLAKGGIAGDKHVTKTSAMADEKKADVGLAQFFIVTDNAKHVDIASPIIYNEMVMVYRKPDARDNWSLLLGPISSVVLYLIIDDFDSIWQEKILNLPTSGIRTRHLKIRRPFLPQSSKHVPEAWSSRAAISTWWIFCMIMAIAYSANMAAHLSVTKDQQLFANLRDLVSQSDYKWGVLDSSSIYTMMDKSNLSVYKQVVAGIAEFSKTDPQVLASDDTQHFLKVMREKYVYLAGRRTVEAQTVVNFCQLEVIGGILQIHSSGLMDKLYQRWYPHHRCPDEDGVAGPAVITLSTGDINDAKAVT